MHSYFARSTPCDQFIWQTNPLLVLAREAVVDSARASLMTVREPVANEMDLVLQTLLSLCYFSPTRIWGGDHATTRSTNQALEEENAQEEVFSEFEAAVRVGAVRPDKALIRAVVMRHLDRHRARERRLRAMTPQLLSAMMEDNLSLFGTRSPTISARPRTVGPDLHSLQRVTVHERSSGKPITLQVVQPDISALYANSFHYIHSARDDELIAFGAYVEHCPFPIAWVSYSPIGARFEQAVAASVGSEGSQVLEMARAWNAEAAPKNTLSTLFAHAHRQLQHLAGTQVLPGVGPNLGGVITAINPNLGFRGMAFRGVDFGVVGTKPTRHSFLFAEGVPVYTLPHVAARVLGVPVTELAQHPSYSENCTSLLPTNLMMVLFDRTARRKPTGPIVVL